MAGRRENADPSHSLTFKSIPMNFLLNLYLYTAPHRYCLCGAVYIGILSLPIVLRNRYECSSVVYFDYIDSCGGDSERLGLFAE